MKTKKLYRKYKLNKSQRKKTNINKSKINKTKSKQFGGARKPPIGNLNCKKASDILQEIQKIEMFFSGLDNQTLFAINNKLSEIIKSNNLCNLLGHGLHKITLDIKDSIPNTVLKIVILKDNTTLRKDLYEPLFMKTHTEYFIEPQEITVYGKNLSKNAGNELNDYYTIIDDINLGNAYIITWKELKAVKNDFKENIPNKFAQEFYDKTKPELERLGVTDLGMSNLGLFVITKGSPEIKWFDAEINNERIIPDFINIL